MSAELKGYVMARDPYIFWVFLREGIIVTSFITVGYV